MSRRIGSGPVGVALVLALALWAFLSRPDAPDAAGTAGRVLLAAGGWVLGALVARLHPAVPGLLVAGAVLLVVAVTLPASLSGGAAAPPLGYGNADAALLLAGTAGLVATSARVSHWHRPWLLLAAAAASVLAVLSGSVAGAAASVLLLAWGTVRSKGPAILWQAVAGALLAAAVGVTVLLGHGGADAAPRFVVSALTDVRVRLWSDALDLAVAEPVRGVGAGAFATSSPTARTDPDLAWAHSAPLQTAAELGWVGFGLLVLLVAWAIVALRRDAMLVTGMLLAATVDYVLQFGWVVLAFSVVLGGSWAATRGTGNPWLTPPSP